MTRFYIRVLLLIFLTFVIGIFIFLLLLGGLEKHYFRPSFAAEMKNLGEDLEAGSPELLRESLAADGYEVVEAFTTEVSLAPWGQVSRAVPAARASPASSAPTSRPRTRSRPGPAAFTTAWARRACSRPVRRSRTRAPATRSPQPST